MPTERLHYEVSKDQTRTRLDRFLISNIKGISRTYVQDLIAQGKVRLNGKPARKGTVLHAEDKIEIEPFLLPEERSLEPNPNIELCILWESKDMVVIEKPAGLPTHPNDFDDPNTLASALIAQYPEAKAVGDERLRPGIVHRLDTNTSGLILAARTDKGFRFLRNQFDERKVKKTYLALVVGEVEREGEVSYPVAHHATNPRKMVAMKPGTKARSRIREAKTVYKPVRHFLGYTLLKVQTLTGRMHQVRVHLSAIGNPLVGDQLYQSATERNRDKTGLKRHFLHAAELTFMAPGEKKLRTMTSELPSELRQVLEKLESN